ncbi:MAG: hypothetical protein LBS61_04560 [Endomicrobium sp.]|jgi:hypothetical protein|nr:hypothetical protein [Endomicrobium sp.]
MQKNKIDRSAINIIYDSFPPIASGIFFIVWAVNLFKHPVMYFPIIAVPVIILYYFSGSIFSGILTSIAIVAGVLECLFFVEVKAEIYILLFECLAIFGAYLVLELYKRRCINVENKFLIERDYLNKIIAEKEFAISENNRISDNLFGQIENFRKIGDILQAFHDSLSEKEIIRKSEDIPFRFFGRGIWKLRKYGSNDEIVSYVKRTSNPLIVYNIKQDNRFENISDEKMSIVAAFIEFNGIFWGVLEGSSRHESFFS